MPIIVLAIKPQDSCDAVDMFAQTGMLRPASDVRPYSDNTITLYGSGSARSLNVADLRDCDVVGVNSLDDAYTLAKTVPDEPCWLIHATRYFEEIVDGMTDDSIAKSIKNMPQADTLWPEVDVPNLIVMGDLFVDDDSAMHKTVNSVTMAWMTACELHRLIDVETKNGAMPTDENGEVVVAFNDEKRMRSTLVNLSTKRLAALMTLNDLMMGTIMRRIMSFRAVERANDDNQEKETQS